MDIGAPKRIIEIEPASLPLPATPEPAGEPGPLHDPAPAHEPAVTPEPVEQTGP